MEDTMTAKINTCSFFYDRVLISAYSYSRGGGTEFISEKVTVAVVARNSLQITVTVAVTARKDGKQRKQYRVVPFDTFPDQTIPYCSTTYYNTTWHLIAYSIRQEHTRT